MLEKFDVGGGAGPTAVTGGHNGSHSNSDGGLCVQVDTTDSTLTTVATAGGNLTTWQVPVYEKNGFVSCSSGMRPLAIVTLTDTTDDKPGVAALPPTHARPHTITS